MLEAMAGGDEFLFDVSRRVLLTSLTDRDAIRYRQQILADCIAQPGIIRQMYGIAVGALRDKRGVWGFWSSQYPSSILSGAINQLDVLIVRLRELRQVADDQAGKFRAAGLTALFSSLQRELDDDYFQTLSHHLKQLRFRDGQLLSAQLGRDNSGISYVLRSGSARRSWKERVGIEPRSVYSFSIPPQGRRRSAGAIGHDQPGDQPGRQRRRPVSRPRSQLLHHAARGARVLRELPQPPRPAHRQEPAGDIPRPGRRGTSRN